MTPRKIKAVKALLVFNGFTSFRAISPRSEPVYESKLVCTCLIVAVFDYVQLFLIAFDFRTLHCVQCWHKFGVSSIKFDYRTQSKSIERLEFDWV